MSWDVKQSCRGRGGREGERRGKGGENRKAERISSAVARVVILVSYAP
jgi:hypothetical protein